MKTRHKLLSIYKSQTTGNHQNIAPLKMLRTLIGHFQLLFILLVKYLTPMRTKKVVIVGTGTFADRLQEFFVSPKSIGYKFLGLFDTQTKNSSYKLQGDINALKEFCKQEEVDEIYFARSVSEKKLIQELSDFADKHFISLRIASTPHVVKSKEGEVSTYFFDNVPVMALRKEPLSSRFNQLIKRGFDIVFSLLVLSVLVPFVFPFIALAIRLESKGPVFFIQKRPGKKNKLFGCFKFRSMKLNTSGEKQATKNDSRITKTGAFLRKTSLDELPQFINVLLGDMSVVGPRPNMIKQLEYYSQVIDNYSFRHNVTPGITGYAQINGFRGETQTVALMEKRVEYDIQYMEKWSLWFDIQIIFLTAWNMIKGEDNAY